jgi:signal transduction histidine kinase
MAAPRTHSPGLFSPPVLRRTLLIFAPAALLICVVALALHQLDRANEHALHEQAGAHLVELHADLITRELKAVESDLLYLANHSDLREFVSQPAADKRSPENELEERRRLLENDYVLFCRQKGIFDQIRYLDAQGMEKIRVNYNNGAPAAVPDRELQPKGDRYYFRQTMLLSHDEVFISPFDLNVEHDEIEKPLKPVIRFATPVFDLDAGGRRTKRGILVLNYLGAALIARLAEEAQVFPGSAWLLNRDGFFLRGPAPSDEWGFMLGHSRRLATYYPEEWERLSGEDRGQFYSPAGLFTFRLLATSPKRNTLGRDLETTPQRSETTPQRGTAPDRGGSHLDPDAADPGLIVTSFVPSGLLDHRATALLRRLMVLSGVVLVLVLILVWYLSYTAALRREQERQLADSEGRLRALSAQLMTAQEEERRSIARDLHDEMGQVVTAMTLDLQRAAQAGESDKKDDLISRALRGAERLLGSIHEVAARIRPTLLDDLGLKDAVQSYLSDYEHRTGVAVHAELQFEHSDVPAIVSENVYRILQEALTNVAKHAQAREVCVALRVTAAQASLTVHDDGAGFMPALVDGKCLGLLGMRERAELLEGTFAVKSEPGLGTEVRVALPLS